MRKHTLSNVMAEPQWLFTMIESSEAFVAIVSGFFAKRYSAYHLRRRLSEIESSLSSP